MMLLGQLNDYVGPSNMRTIKILALAAVVGLQGCVVPTAMDALHHWDSYDIVTERQIDAHNFRIAAAIYHNRGEFDLLATHGSHVVTRSIDVELWRLSVTDSGIAAKKEDARTFATKEEIENWYKHTRNGVGIDMVHGRITLSPLKPGWEERRIPASNLLISRDQETVHGLVNGRQCTVSMSRANKDVNAFRDFVLNTAGDHLMVIDRIGKGGHAVILNICDAKAPRHDIPLPIERTDSFSTYPDGSPSIIRGRKFGLNASSRETQSYEVQIYPGPERLTFNEEGLGLNEKTYSSPSTFMFDERTRRFHWLVAPYDSSRFIFITYDAVSGTTVKYEFSLKGK